MLIQITFPKLHRHLHIQVLNALWTGEIEMNEDWKDKESRSPYDPSFAADENWDYGHWIQGIRQQFERIFDERDYNSKETLESALQYFVGAKKAMDENEKEQQRMRHLMSVCVNWGQIGIPLEEAEERRKWQQKETERLNIFNDMMGEGIRSYHLGK